MVEVRMIHKDGTCAVFTHVLYIDFDNEGINLYIEGTFNYRYSMSLSWDKFKSIKVVKK